VFVALLLALVLARPDSFTVERSANIAAPPAVVYGLVQDFHAWEKWSPWAKLDPAMKTTYGGAAGVGATYAWEGNDEVGAGKMTIDRLQPNESIVISLEFLKPMASTNSTEFRLAPDGNGTKVTWRMQGHNDFLGKAFGLVMNMDQLIGKDFEKGLGQLRAAAESASRAAEEASRPVEAEETEEAPNSDAGTP
jgi:uncharacterized protein YndB with AHSA1/START domain